MISKYSNQSIFVKSPAKLSKLKQQLSSLIKKKSIYIKEIFSNNVLVSGGMYLQKRKCGNKSCKCSKTDYRHENYYLYRSIDGKTHTTYITADKIDILKIQTGNYQKFRKAREQLVKLEKQIMQVINEIEKVKTIPFLKGKKSNEKKK